MEWKNERVAVKRNLQLSESGHLTGPESVLNLEILSLAAM